MTTILAFDVSNNSCSVSIARGQNILADEEDLRPSMQAENLLLLIEKALKFAKLEYTDIDYLAFTNGPGSFTGIRIGLAAAEGILIASKIKAVPISNFEMAYYRLARFVKSFDKALVLLNAYRGQLYYQQFDNIGHKGEFGIIDITAVGSLLQQHEDERIIVAGSGVPVVYDQIENMAGITILPRCERIKATNICRYADEKIKQGDFSKVEPLYIRPPDAKVAAGRG
jgi:tRNA threonylcarbamoyladenosine biosynthesis protein TsaB